eukprot:symbB.v1.2.017052.t1/scaffold1314.1/size125707/5
MLLLLWQDMSMQAVRLNKELKLKRSASESALAACEQDSHRDSGGPNQLVSAEQATQLDDQISDEHFAVAESVLDKARAECQGNWLTIGHKQFREDFAQFVELTKETQAFQDDDDEEETCCETFYGPGICKQQFVGELSNRYNKLFEHVVEILRLARDIRRREGFVADHPLLLLCDAETGRIVRVFLMGQVSFNPFDATLIEFNLRDDLVAVMATIDGEIESPLIFKLTKLLFGIAQGGEVFNVKTGKYAVVSLSQIRIDDGSIADALGCGAPVQPLRDGDNADSDSSGNDDSVVRTRQALLRKAILGFSNAKTKKSTVGSTKGKAKAVPKRTSQATRSTNRKQEVIEDKSEDSAERQVLLEWKGALEAQLGPCTSGTEKASSSSSSTAMIEGKRANSSASSSKAIPSPIPIVSKTMPWRDEKGYCWCYNPDTGRACQLGRVLKYEK